MRFITVLTVATSVAALSTAALAGPDKDKAPVNPTPPVEGTMPAEPAPADEAMPAPPVADESAADASATTPAPAMIPGDSPTPPDQAFTLKAGDPSVTSNPPVADTPESRAAFGGPQSNGGKKTKPVGN